MRGEERREGKSQGKGERTLPRKRQALPLAEVII